MTSLTLVCPFLCNILVRKAPFAVDGFDIPVLRFHPPKDIPMARGLGSRVYFEQPSRKQDSGDRSLVSPSTPKDSKVPRTKLGTARDATGGGIRYRDEIKKLHEEAISREKQVWSYIIGKYLFDILIAR